MMEAIAIAITTAILILILSLAARRPSRDHSNAGRVTVTDTGPYFAEQVARERARKNLEIDARIAEQTAARHREKAAAARRRDKRAMAPAMKRRYRETAADHDRQAAGYTRVADERRERARTTGGR